MAPLRSLIQFLSITLALGLLVGCQPAPVVVPTGGPDKGMTEELVASSEDVKLRVVAVDLRRSYQTYYLMNYPPDDQLFLRLVVSIEGAEDPVAWGERDLQLRAAASVRRPVFGRPFAIGERFRYGSAIPDEFAYEFFFLVPDSNQTMAPSLLVAGTETLALPELPPLERSPDLTTARGGRPPARVLSGEGNEAGAEGAVVVAGRGNQAGATFTTIAGGQLNQAQLAYGSVSGGRENRTGGFYAAIGGGYGNQALGRETAVAGGSRNQADGYYAAIGGGIQNQATSSSATVAGGAYNQAQALYAAVGGGTRNQAMGDSSVVAGGAGNQAAGRQAAVLGGLGNAAAGDYAASLGGHGSLAAGDYAVTLGGEGNQALADYSLAAGRGATIEQGHSGAILLADSTPAEFSSKAPDELAVRASGGVRFVTSVAADGAPVSGVELSPGSGSWSFLSDIHQKTDLERIDPIEVLSGVEALDITSWRYQSQAVEIRHIGPSAQDFRRTFGLGESAARINTVDANGVALAAIQGMLIELEARDRQLAQMETELQRLEGRMAQLEGMAVQPGEAGSGLPVPLPLAVILALASGLWLGRSVLGGRRPSGWPPGEPRFEISTNPSAASSAVAPLGTSQAGKAIGSSGRPPCRSRCSRGGE